jgi:TatD DNase family protein
VLIDSHAHLDYEYDFSTEELLANAKNAGVKGVIAIAAAADSLEKTKKLAEQFPEVYFTSGIHPHDSKDFNPSILETIRKNHQHPKCVAVGELGLDFFYTLSEKKIQFDAFEIQLNLSIELGKPVVVHTREADEDTLRFLTKHSKEFFAKHGKSPGVIHCFTGGEHLARECLNLGYYISFSGILTFKNAEDLRKIAKEIVPIEKMLVETDSPFLAPIPFRGKKNQPAHTIEVAKLVANLKGVSFEEVAERTRMNTVKLFSLPLEFGR